MEPEHLEKDEIEHELNIRGMPPQVTRLRARNLRERFLMEMRKEVEAPVDCLNPDLSLELTIVDGKLKQLDYVMVNSADSNCFKSMEVLSTRLYHLYGRLLRIRSEDQRIIKHQGLLKKKLCSYIEVVHLALEGKVVMKDQLKSLNLSAISTSTVDEARAVTPIPASSFHPGAKITSQQGRDLLTIPESLAHINVSSILRRPTRDTSPPRSTAGEDLSARIDALELNGDSDDEISEILLNNIRAKKTGAVPKKVVSPVSNFQNYRTTGYTANLVPRANLDEAFFPRKTRRDPNEWRKEVFVDDTIRIVPKPVTPMPVNRPYPILAEVPLPEAFDTEERRRFRNRNPILNWQLVFTGVQGKGLSISDFLTQVHLMARADSVSERELFLSAIHLFAGSARNWYVAFEKYYDNWQQLVNALKEQFLPHDSDLCLLREAESRKQRPDEAFVLYLSSMMNLFDHLQVQLPETRKLSIVMRNMLPYLRQALALTDVLDFNTLVRLCRKLESIRSTTVSHSISEITTESSSHGEAFCHNCQETGHLFSECKHPKIRVFCYRCGELGQLATTCTKCHQVQGNQLTRPSYPNNFARGGR